jgi:hypothetical protein
VKAVLGDDVPLVRQGRLRRACSIRCRSAARRCRSAGRGRSARPPRSGPRRTSRVRCPDDSRPELVGRRCRHGCLRQACSIRCRSAGRCRSTAHRCRSAGRGRSARLPNVTAESKPVVVVSTVTRQARRLAAGRLYDRENVIVPNLIPVQLVLGAHVKSTRLSLEHRWSGRRRNICRWKLKRRLSGTS